MAKICIVLHDLRGGGAEKMMVRLANQMIEDGDQVDMILITEGGSNKPYLSKEVNLIELRCERTLNAFGPLRSALKRCQPDGILAALTHINVITAITCASLGWLKKLSVSERNAFSLDKKVNSDKVMKATYFLAPYIYRLLPNPVIAVSKGVAQDLIDTTVVRAKDVVTAPNPVITKETELAARQPPKHPWLVDKSMPTVIAVGRLSYQKGFDMLLDAFADVQKNIPSRLIIFGEGELREELEQQINKLGLNDNVSLPGYSDNIIAEMKAADLYVLSSRFEGSPNAIVEAMSVGTQVVAFDCPHGAREILQDGRIAPLVQANCAKNLTHPISQQLNYISAIETSSSLTASVERFKSKNSSSIYRDFLLRSV
ncbi:group 1 glycosyl transferase [Alteromonas mediterranea MED64]|uniref:glycosyltransferase n=1 Tax=Alteromonas mediterranea TaxID=314275 RepID=UPI0003556400|nr:glycosyltransferase [Alteromonas mediterranea]AGP81534.1 group 1 glycosyl transferase [Alteromonas mediterranea MED64]